MPRAADQGPTLGVFGLSCSHARGVFGVSTPWHMLLVSLGGAVIEFMRYLPHGGSSLLPGAEVETALGV